MKRDLRRDLQMQRIRDALAKKPATPTRLAIQLHMSLTSMNVYLRRLHQAPKEIYVRDYEHPETRGKAAKVWALGNKCDKAFKPKKRLSA